MSGKTGDCGLADEKQELCHKKREFGTLLNQCFAVYGWVLGPFAAPGWADRFPGRVAVVQHARLAGSKSGHAGIYLRVEGPIRDWRFPRNLLRLVFRRSTVYCKAI